MEKYVREKVKVLFLPKKKGQVNKLLACKITHATRSNKIVRSHKIVRTQPPEVFCKKKVYLKFSHCAHRKTPALESPLNKVAGSKPSNFIKKRPQHRCFPVNIWNF